LALAGGERSFPCPVPLNPWVKDLSTGGWVGHRASLDVFEKRKSHTPARIETRFLSSSL